MEILQVADAVAREKGIEQEVVLAAMEEAIQKAGRSKYGHEFDIRVTIDRQNGDIKLFRYQEVIEDDAEMESESAQIFLKDALVTHPDIKVGEFIIEPLPPLDFGRVAAQTARQVIMQKVREAERERQFEEYKDRVAEIVNGVVKRVEYGNVTVDLGRAEGYIRRDETLPREHFKNGDRVRAYIYEVRQEQRGPQIFLSRTHPAFMAKLFQQEVPEIYDGVIEIKAVARDPGSRAKIAVLSYDNSIDPVGACVGMRGSRVQAVVNELQGEKIDIIPWTEDVASFVVSALAPAQVAKVVLDEDTHRMDVVVPDEQLSLAIGRRGQNVRLASILSGWDIDIMTEAEESERRNAEFKTRSALFMEALDVDEVIAHLLVIEGFSTIEEIAETDINELARIEGFDEDVAAELQNRAQIYITQKAEEFEKSCKKLKIAEDLIGAQGLTREMIITLAENGIKTLEDLADLASDEFIEYIGEEKTDQDHANTVIMDARKAAGWFADEEEEAAAEEGEDSALLEDAPQEASGAA
ncbi:MAG: transcription termination/antitermination protein NusA [Pseudomonadota bacterium]|nr:transcription termination/antitermination protein NusA [Pseudomonadota bacterium]QKK05327.1 MAG: transcription termination/antitermination protein NusA [Pseudomonadota bacterium]